MKYSNTNLSLDWNEIWGIVTTNMGFLKRERQLLRNGMLKGKNQSISLIWDVHGRSKEEYIRDKTQHSEEEKAPWKEATGGRNLEHSEKYGEVLSMHHLPPSGNFIFIHIVEKAWYNIKRHNCEILESYFESHSYLCVV